MLNKTRSDDSFYLKVHFVLRLYRVSSKKDWSLRVIFGRLIDNYFCVSASWNPLAVAISRALLMSTRNLNAFPGEHSSFEEE